MHKPPHFILAPPLRDDPTKPDLAQKHRWANRDEWPEKRGMINDLRKIAKQQSPGCVVWRWRQIGEGDYVRALNANDVPGTRHNPIK